MIRKRELTDFDSSVSSLFCFIMISCSKRQLLWPVSPRSKRDSGAAPSHSFGVYQTPDSGSATCLNLLESSCPPLTGGGLLIGTHRQTSPESPALYRDISVASLWEMEKVRLSSFANSAIKRVNVISYKNYIIS